jgi:uncharacterized membrane protein
MIYDDITHYFMLVLYAIKWFLATVGVLIIFLGGVQAAYMLLKKCLFVDKRKREFDLDDVRKELALSIVLGLEFILASDVILTIVLPDYYNLGLLAILVVIRTILNYFLDKELMQLSAKNNA